MRHLKLLCVWLCAGALPLMADLAAGAKAYDERDYLKALAELTPLAEEGSPEAEYYVGVMRFFGQGTQTDYRGGINWLHTSAEAGFAHAAGMLGLLYSMGSNTPWHQQVPTDLAEAVKWLVKAVERDDSLGESRLGYLYESGQGVRKDLGEAVRLYRLAAEQGVADSQIELGFLYCKGEGVIKDYVEAYMWFNLAAAQDQLRPTLSFSSTSDNAEKARDTLEALMTTEQLAEAQRLTRHWKRRKQREQ